MIRYALVCDRTHDFESWFPSSDAFEEQTVRGLVTCPICGSTRVSKQMMAPSVVESAGPRETPGAGDEETGPVNLVSGNQQRMRALLAELREYVEQNAEHVGRRFPDEARKIHYGEAEKRSIYGEASREDTRSLLEEGIDITPLPFFPGDRN
ncbi:MAG: DUF1178 family protein [Methylobacteriaceae bacterium]|jgi:hypothetical protein|nr:DUF1178 family protein [Methylobacteriaceae bacterium]